MFAQLDSALQEAIDQNGTPLAVEDLGAKRIFILLAADVEPSPLGDMRASIPGFPAIGEGETKQEASIALCEALRGYLNAFGDR